MSTQPVNLALTGRSLRIQWSDGRSFEYDVGELRRNCPCATCRNERNRAGAAAERPKVDPNVTVQQMAPVGNYAYKIRFSDGHDTGIYTLELLQELGRLRADRRCREGD